MSDKNEIIRSAAAQVAENYRKSDILMYGDALRLPSRTAVIEIIRDFQKILFPAYYGDRDLLKLPPEQYSALLMGHVYDKLLRQLELVMPEGEEGARRAEKVCEAMMERLPHIQELLLKDLTANYNGDPAASSRQEIILSYPGMFAIFIYRIAHELYLEKVPMIPRIMTEYAHSQTGIDINPGATIGEYFSIDHGTGVVVGETTIIGDRVQLYQGVTLGGNGKETGKRHPTLKDNVMVSAGAKIIGSFTIGENSKIGAGSVVIEEVPPNCTVVGVPGHIVKQNDVRIPRKSMDHIHLPDPIFEDIKVLQQENTELTNRVLELEGELRQMRKKERTEQK